MPSNSITPSNVKLVKQFMITRCLKHEIVFYIFIRFLLTASHCICLFPDEGEVISSSESCINPTDENGIAQDQLARGLIKIWYFVGHRKIEILARYHRTVYEAKKHPGDIGKQGIIDANTEYENNLRNLPRAEKGYVFHTKQFSNGDTCKKCEADIGLLVIEPIARWQSRDVKKIDGIRLPKIPEGLVRRQLYLYKQIDIRCHHIYIL